MEIYGNSVSFNCHDSVATTLRELERRSKRHCPNLLNTLDSYLSYCIFNKLEELAQTLQDAENKENLRIAEQFQRKNY